MKKIIVAILILALCLSMTACGTPRFDSQEAMLSYLNGVWMVESIDDIKEYYVFQDGNIYTFHDQSVTYQIDSFLSNTYKTKGLDALLLLDYPSFLTSVTVADILSDPLDSIEINHKKGEIILDKDGLFEKHIIVEENSVGIKDADEDYSTSLIKISDTVDLSIEKYQTYFNESKNSFTVPTQQFWTDVKEYGALVKAYNPVVDGWELTTATDTTTIYESNKRVTSMSGALIVSKDAVTYTYKVSVTKDWTPWFVINYTPESGTLQIIDQDNLSLDVPLLFQYAAYAVKQFPGAYEDYMDLYNSVMSETGTISSSVHTREKTINGLTYHLQLKTDKTWAFLTVKANDTLTLGTIMGNNANISQERVCPQCEKTEPDTAFAEDWKSGDLCSLCLSDSQNNSNPSDDENTSNSGSSSGSGNSSGGGSPSGDGNTSSGGSSSGGDNASDNTSSSETIQPQPTSCSHNYADATCTTPKTCTLCGEISGQSLGHSYSAATCKAPETCKACGVTRGRTAAHKWSNITKTVQHEEQGHYAEAQEAIYVEKIKCFACSNKSDTIAEYYTHFDTVHGNSNHYLLVRDRYETVSDKVYKTVTEWVVDQKAYTETVVIGRKCDICGTTE